MYVFIKTLKKGVNDMAGINHKGLKKVAKTTNISSLKVLINKYLNEWTYCKSCDLYIHKNTKCNC